MSIRKTINGRDYLVDDNGAIIREASTEEMERFCEEKGIGLTVLAHLETMDRQGTGPRGRNRWLVRLTRNGQQIHETEYSAGAAFYVYTSRHQMDRRAGRVVPHGVRLADDLKHITPQQPTAPAVLCCLVTDAQCVRDMDIDEYADNFCDGMKPSEIIRTYQACQATERALARTFTAAELEELEAICAEV